MTPTQIVGMSISGVLTAAMIMALTSIRSWVKTVNTRLTRIEAHLKIPRRR